MIYIESRLRDSSRRARVVLTTIYITRECASLAERFSIIGNSVEFPMIEKQSRAQMCPAQSLYSCYFNPVFNFSDVPYHTLPLNDYDSYLHKSALSKYPNVRAFPEHSLNLLRFPQDVQQTNGAGYVA